MQIKYSKGPENLRSVSIEVTDSIEQLIKEGCSIDNICNILNVSSSIVDEVKAIKKSGLKRCWICGDLFDAKSTRRAICYAEKHYLPCPDCGKPVEVKETSYAMFCKHGFRRCWECRSKAIGIARRSKSEEENARIIAKQQKTMIERYGAATPLQVPEMKAKIQATIKQRYGVDNLSQSTEIQNRIKENSQKRYGVDHYSNAPEIRQRMQEGMIQKYGDTCAQRVPELKEQTRLTNLEKYGVENVFQSAEIRQKAMDNHRAKYGVNWPNQRKENLTDPTKFEEYLKFEEDPEEYILTHYINQPSTVQIGHDIGLDSTTVSTKLAKLGIKHLCTPTQSCMEAELTEFICKCNPKLQIIKQDRSIITPQEIDVYLPELKIGFECNPTCTHNSSFSDPWGGSPKHYKYHANKSKLALDNDVFIYHIFGYEWTNKRDLIQSQIMNLIGSNPDKIYGRNTEIKLVSANDASKFLDDNHRQGPAVASVRLGLYDKQNGQLVSLMTFGKMRHGIGKKSDQTDNEYELIRFCNLKYTSVVGGASKLFKHFIKEYNPDKVVSFSDVAHTKGSLYQTLGFTNVSISSPGYTWVNIYTDKYYNRVNCQKKNLPKLFSDVTEHDINNLTEPQIMMQHNYAQVFDSGVTRWEWYK